MWSVKSPTWDTPAWKPPAFPAQRRRPPATLFRELGLVVPSAHVFPPAVGAKLDEALDTLAALDCQRLVSGLGPDDFKTMDGIKQSCERFNASNAAARARGFTFAIHNHWWEYLKVDGRYVYHVMLEQLDPSVLFELDTYWIQTAGCDPLSRHQRIRQPRAAAAHQGRPGHPREPMIAARPGRH